MSLIDNQGNPSAMGLSTLQNVVSAINGLVQVTKSNASVTAGVRTQRLVTSSPINVQPNDNIINVNISAGSATCQLPLASTRNGLALSFKDVGGNFSAHTLTLTCSGADTIDGLTTITLNVNRQYLNLVPANDGTTAGWSIE